MNEFDLQDQPILGDMLVVDLSNGIAGAYTSKLLSDGGATTVRVEEPGGSPLRCRVAAGMAVDPDEGSALFQFLDGGKRSVVVDDSADGGHDRHRLLAAADVVITDEHDGNELHETYPAAIVVSHTPYGLTGRWSGRPATDLTLQAWSGSIAGRGAPAASPVAAGGDLASWVSGAAAAAGVLAAWRAGVGTLVDVSELETAVVIYNGFQTVARELTGLPSPSPARVVEVPSIEPARDGWVGFCALSAQQFEAFAVMIGHPEWAADPDVSRIDYRSAHSAELRAVIAEWTSTRTVSEIVVDAAARRIPCAPVGNGETVTEVEQFVVRETFVANPSGGFLQPRPPMRMSRSRVRGASPAPRRGAHAIAEVLAGRTPRPPSTVAAPWPLPLAGLRVFDMTSFWAGPVVTQLLAAFGADVIKVESTQRPDGTRMATSYGITGDRAWERAPLFHGCNTGKLGITLDLTRAEGRDLAKRLLAQCDVLIENYTPRVVERFGLLDDLRDDQIVVRMPAWGLDGPWRDQPGFAQTTEQVSGLGWVTGDPAGAPLVPRGPCDPNGGYHALVGTLLALLERDRTGRGQVVESALVDAALNIAAQQVVEFTAYGERLDRTGNRSRSAAPQGVYPAHGDDGWLAVSVASDQQWDALCEVLGRADWAADPELRTVAGRRARHDELDVGIAAWTVDQDVDVGVERLWSVGVPVGNVIAPRDVGFNPQLGDRGFFEEVNHPVVGPVRLPRFPARLSSRDVPFHLGPAPTLGQHNRDVLSGLLGLDDRQLDALEQDGVIGYSP